MTYGLVLTWLFWPPLAAYMFWKGFKTYGLVCTAAPLMITALLVGIAQVEPDAPLFLSLFIHGIVITRLVAEALRPA